MKQHMMKKGLWPSVVLCGLLASTTYGLISTEWTGGTGNWETGTSWSGGVTPSTVSQDLRVNIVGGLTTDITLSSAVTVGLLAVGNNGADTMNHLTLANGAYLTAGIESGGKKNFTAIAYQRATTMTVQPGATLDCQASLIFGRQGTSATGTAYPSYLNILGGTVKAAGVMIIGNDQASRNSGGGVVTIDNNGTLQVASLQFWNHVSIFDSYIQINDGTMILNGDVDIQALINAGTLKGENLTWDYDDTNLGKTTVIPEPATIGLLGLGALGTLLIRRLRLT